MQPHSSANFQHENHLQPERGQHAARMALKDLLAFHDALEIEMREMLKDTQIGMSLDNDMFEKMLAAKNYYVKVMLGLRTNSTAEQRNLLIAFADSIQDLMVCFNRKRSH